MNHHEQRHGHQHRRRQQHLQRAHRRDAGPVSGDGSNGPSVLNASGVVRNDIRRASPASAATCQPRDRLRWSAANCAGSPGEPSIGDRLGRYSLYNQGVTNQNYLRGVQEADANGRLTFTAIFPGCYAGRWPHIHFEVYPSLAGATNVANRVATSQIALPKSACDLVYATSGYQTSVTNLSQVSLATDNVFSDGSALELATVTGSVASGFSASLTVAI